MTALKHAAQLTPLRHPAFDLDAHGTVCCIDPDPSKRPVPLHSGRIGVILSEDRVLEAGSAEILSAIWQRLSWSLASGRRQDAVRLVGPLSLSPKIRFLQRDFSRAPRALLAHLSEAIRAGDLATLHSIFQD